MKKIKFLSAFIALFTAISFTSCQVEQLDSELLETPEEVTGPALFMVDFGVETLVATNAQATVNGGALTIIGLTGADGEAVGINLPAITGTGVYTNADMTYLPAAASTTSFSNTNPANGASNGAVNITSINTTTKTISGTFSFTGYVTDASLNLPAVPFTNGIFQNIPYTGNMPGTNPGPGPDPVEEEYFIAKLGDNLIDFGIIQAIPQSGMLSISGTEGTNSVQLLMSQTITQGTYSLGMGIPTAIATTGGTAAYNATSGTLTIISNSNGVIKGTFNFTGSNMMAPGSTLAVTEGSFNIEL